MSRTRALIVVALLVVFVVVAGVLIYANTNKGGQARTFDVTVSGAKSMTPSSSSRTSRCARFRSSAPHVACAYAGRRC